MVTTFKKLNEGWNAEPNAPNPQIKLEGQTLELLFFLNPWMYAGCWEGQYGRLVFTGVGRYRMGSTNDEGWYRGKCRFSHLAPSWGEFYEVEGDLLLDESPGDWIEVDSSRSLHRRHYLFYFRDSTFECNAAEWQFFPETSAEGPA